MPPTLAAARNTACGRLAANHLFTAAWSRRSTSERVSVWSSTSSCASRRISAAPTMPRWPATNTVMPFSSNGVLAIGDLPPRDLKVARNHLFHELGKWRLRLPAELLVCLAGIADQKIDLSRAKIHRIDANDGLAGFLVDPGFIDALAAPLDAAADFRKRQLDELAHRPGLAGRQHEVVGLIDLQDPVHAFDIVLGMAPVALGFEIAEKHRFLEASFDARHAARDLARHKSLAADRAFVVEQDAVGGEHAVGLAVIHRDPVAIEFCDRIGRARIEWRGFLLRHFLDQTI